MRTSNTTPSLSFSKSCAEKYIPSSSSSSSSSISICWEMKHKNMQYMTSLSFTDSLNLWRMCQNRIENKCKIMSHIQTNINQNTIPLLTFSLGVWNVFQVLGHLESFSENLSYVSCQSLEASILGACSDRYQKGSDGTLYSQHYLKMDKKTNIK